MYPVFFKYRCRTESEACLGPGYILSRATLVCGSASAQVARQRIAMIREIPVEFGSLYVIVVRAFRGTEWRTGQ
jgi:hypothetical protein